VASNGVIEYSLGESHMDYLRCAFIIRTLNHSGFVFTLEEDGLVEDPYVKGGPINIFTFGPEGVLDTAHLLVICISIEKTVRLL